MTQPPSRADLAKFRKLAQLPDEARHSQFAVSITRLTVLKSLCREPEVAARFVTYLARRTRDRVEEKAERPGYLEMEAWARQRDLLNRAVGELERHLGAPTEEGRARLWKLFHELAGEQNEYRRVHGTQVRVIKNTHLLLVEYALRTVLADEASAPVWAYQTARHYAERCDSSYGTGLIPASAPLVQDIVDFWADALGAAARAGPPAGKEPRERRAPRGDSPPGTGKRRAAFTPRQGQFMAFIRLYRKLHRQGPAELDMAQFFRLTPPAVHGMVVKLEQLGLITREPGVARSARVAIPEEEIPELADVVGPPW